MASTILEPLPQSLLKKLAPLGMALGLTANLAAAQSAISSIGPHISISGVFLVYQGQPLVLRGENFNNGPAQSDANPDINLINVNESDYAKAHDLLGLNVIRFGLDYWWYNSNRTKFFAVMDQHVAWAKAHRLWMIPVMFNAPSANNGEYSNNQSAYWNSSANQQLLVNFWQDVATHYASDTTIAGYDIFNEPSPPSIAAYSTMAQNLYSAITAADPNHLVVIESSSPNGTGAGFPTVTDSQGALRVLWSTHCYGVAGSSCGFSENYRPLWVGEMGSTGSPSGDANGTYVPGNLSYYNNLGVSWAHFLMHSWYSPGNNYGLYNDEGAGNFNSPWTSMIQAVQSAAAGTTSFPQRYPDAAPVTTPVLSVSPATLNFGTVTNGYSYTNSLLVGNAGGGTLNGTASVASPFFIVGTAAFNIASNAARVTINIGYTPTDAASDSGTLTLTGGGGATVPLTATLFQVFGLSFASIAGTITSPFATNSSGYISQTTQTTDPTQGGEADYYFIVTNTGDYVISASANAPNTGANSFFVNIDAQPTSPAMIWDSPVTSGFHTEIVSWRGNGTDVTNQFVPKVFTLSAGMHQLVIRGREANTQLGRITLIPSGPKPPPPTGLRITNF